MMSRWANTMTTPTPISEVASAQSAGWPDEATLARLANEFFAALPGADKPATPGIERLGHGELASAQSSPGTVRSGPGQQSSATPGLTTAAPLTDAERGGFAAAIPRLDPPTELPGAMPVAMPTHPYYFLAESSTFQSAPTQLPAFDDHLLKQIPGLPSDTALQALLAQLADVGRKRKPRSAQSDAPHSHLYFLDPLKQGPIGPVPAAGLESHPLFNVQAVRRDFPIL